LKKKDNDEGEEEINGEQQAVYEGDIISSSCRHEALPTLADKGRLELGSVPLLRAFRGPSVELKRDR